MTKYSEAGKGSSSRPKQVSDEEYANRWDMIFGRNKNRNKAIVLVADFYKVTIEEVKELFMDEVEAYERLLEKGVRE